MILALEQLFIIRIVLQFKITPSYCKKYSFGTSIRKSWNRTR